MWGEVQKVKLSSPEKHRGKASKPDFTENEYFFRSVQNVEDFRGDALSGWGGGWGGGGVGGWGEGGWGGGGGGGGGEGGGGGGGGLISEKRNKRRQRRLDLESTARTSAPKIGWRKPGVERA